MQFLLPRANTVRIAFTNHSARSHLSARTVRVAAMSSQPLFDIAVKGNPTENILGDCPFCHRALLALEEKHVPYSKTYIDFNNKPQWLLDVNPAGTVPAMKELSTGEWLTDSGLIVDMVEKRFSEPGKGPDGECPKVAGGIFPAFRAFGKAAPGEEAAAKEKELIAALEELEDYLQKQEGTYIGGAEPCSSDLLIWPFLYHTKIALKHFKNWEMPAHLKAIRAYMDAFMARESWKNTAYSPELVIAGWERHGMVVSK